MAEDPNESWHSSHYYSSHPDKKPSTRPEAGVKEVPSLMPLYSVPLAWLQHTTSTWEAIITIVENGIVLTILITGLGSLMMYWPPALYLCLGVCLIGAHRSKALRDIRSLRLRVLAYILCAVVFFLALRGLRVIFIDHVVTRAYIRVNVVRMEERDGQFVVYVSGVVGGESIVPSVVMNMAITGGDYTLDQDEIDKLFRFADWGGSGWLSGGKNVLNPGDTFEFHKVYQPYSVPELQKVLGGQKVLFVLTKALFADKYGPVPTKHSCSYLIKGDNFSMRHRCFGGDD